MFLLKLLRECMWLACGRVLGVVGMHNCLEFDFQYGS